MMASDREIRLWAPLAKRADAVVVPATPRGRLDRPLSAEELSGAQWLPMARLDDEHWAIALPAGTDYLLSVDGGDPRPDPRSARQPYGVHGPSRVFDETAFSWTDGEWGGLDVLGEVFYELHVGTFTPQGTLDAAIDRLDHLVNLGVRVVELMPVVPFPGERGWGYDGVSLYAVHEAYGGPEALQRFVDACHARRLGVCLDVVYNHFGPAGNYASVFAPYLTGRHQTPWGDAINLDDAHSDGVRAFITDNACRWLRDFHADALRLDAVHELRDDSPVHILAELSRRVDDLRPALGRPVSLVAESDRNQPSTVLSRDDGGLGLDAQWADDVHHALHAYLTGERFGYYVDFGSPEVLGKALEHVFVHDGSWSTFRGRPWGAPVPDDLDRRRFVVFTQNHDQVGNRGRGDRPDARLEPGIVAGGAAILLLGPFTPMLFQGQEWGTTRPFQFFTDHDPDLGRAVTAGRLREFQGHEWSQIYGTDAAVPDPQSPATFTASKLDWDEPSRPEHARMLSWYRTLIDLRRAELPGDGSPATTAHGPGWFSMTYGPFTVVLAPGTASADVAVRASGLVTGFGQAELDTSGVLYLPGGSVAVLRN
ncbi:malto-oligosyltrehalose trehalohydrolase [Brooklawnia cerclae]|uniref:Malto-oligosyltrehalose trehalohydrolase n=1 Tax=Brooklawnia cerclae TaxID=349934 RepID=A0ABX0SF14_9ACTN|nr:malto-oligosyltrehalose trehalohydrolase [Brooklawnia cerclae]NIH56967.1 maltooligosyltrehalose trehalohydrolase [Brooklawnia cerclae]